MSISGLENASLANGNSGVASGIQRAHGGVGYVEYGIAKRAGLGIATLENKSGKYIKPTPNSGLEALLQTDLPGDLRVFVSDPEAEDAYPIVTYSWLLLHRTYDDQKKAEALKTFVRWCLDDGQKYSESLGYIRLAPRALASVTTALETGFRN
jgi:phosphate transport system substrate-binding protein